MEVTSLILGIIGTVTGIGALAWQVVTWKRSGPVVTLITRRRGRYEAEVIARNSGRGPVSVESLGVTVDGRRRGPATLAPESDEIHCRLEAGDSAFWVVDACAELAAPTRRRRATSSLGFYLSLGNGDTVTSNELEIPEAWTRPASG
jgi:hypothetical protein